MFFISVVIPQNLRDFFFSLNEVIQFQDYLKLKICETNALCISTKLLFSSLVENYFLHYSRCTQAFLLQF